MGFGKETLRLPQALRIKPLLGLFANNDRSLLDCLQGRLTLSSFLQMKISLEKLHQGITVAEPPLEPE